MYRIITATALGLMSILGVSAQSTSLYAPFETMPKDFTFYAQSPEAVVSNAFYKSVKPSEGWYLSPANSVLDEGSGESRMCALSCSWRPDGVATDNWMITAPVAAAEGMVLSWEAKSIHFGMRESYKVMISESGTDPASFNTLLNIENEDYLWRVRSIDLSEYAGKEIRIAFVHNSNNGYLLAIDEIVIDTPSRPKLIGRNIGPHFFAADEQPYLEFDVENHGYALPIDGFEARTDEKVIGSCVTPGRMELAVDLNEPQRYKLYAKYSDGSEQYLFDDFVNKSWYRRKMLVEKFTGAWCNNCPRVTFPYHYLLEKYNDGEVCSVEAHSPGSGTGDIDGYDDYMNGVNSVCGDYPALWLNRAGHLSNTYQPLDMESLLSPELTPTLAQINIVSATRSDDGLLDVTAEVTFAEDIDNSEDVIRPHFALVEKEAVQQTAQKWQSPAQDYRHAEYYFMPASVPRGLTIMHNVVRSSSGCMTGIMQSGLPSQIKAGESYRVSGRLNVPETKIQNLANLQLIADIVDASTRTYQVLNAASMDIDLAPEQEPFAEISLSASELKIEEDELATLNYILDPVIDGVNVEWSSSDESVAEIFEFPKPDLLGYVHDETAIGVYGKKAGTAVITATTSQGKSASCTVVVAAKSGVFETEALGAEQIFDLQGRRISGNPDNLPGGIYIVRNGSKVRKIAR